MFKRKTGGTFSMSKKKLSWWKRFLKWIEEASKKEPPQCGCGGGCKK
jgi:hypothetical protein